MGSALFSVESKWFFVDPVNNLRGNLLDTCPRPTCREPRKISCIGRSGFVVFSTALPFLAALGEDASEEFFASFKSGRESGRAVPALFFSCLQRRDAAVTLFF